MNLDQSQPPARRFPWLTVILAILAIITLIAGSEKGGGVVPMMMLEGFGIGGGSSEQTGGSPAIGDMAVQGTVSSASRPDYYYGNGDVPITDTREFLKTDYNATLRTRDVQGLVRKTETIVRGHDGRIDNTSSSEKYGYVQFAIPESAFEQFRDEIEQLVGPKFLSISISQQNMLPQKISIEEQQAQTENTVESLKTQKQKLIADHNYSIGTYERQMGRNETAIVELMSESTNDPARQAEIDSQIKEFQQQNSVFESRIASEKAAHNSKLSSLDAQIKSANLALQAVKTQDQELLDTVATVRGAINFQWISLWEIAHLYLPGLWIPGIIATLAALAFTYERRLYFFKNY